MHPFPVPTYTRSAGAATAIERYSIQVCLYSFYNGFPSTDDVNALLQLGR